MYCQKQNNVSLCILNIFFKIHDMFLKKIDSQKAIYEFCSYTYIKSKNYVSQNVVHVIAK